MATTGTPARRWRICASAGEAERGQAVRVPGARRPHRQPAVQHEEGPRTGPPGHGSGGRRGRHLHRPRLAHLAFRRTGLREPCLAPAAAPLLAHHPRARPSGVAPHSADGQGQRQDQAAQESLHISG